MAATALDKAARQVGIKEKHRGTLQRQRLQDQLKGVKRHHEHREEWKRLGLLKQTGNLLSYIRLSVKTHTISLSFLTALGRKHTDAGFFGDTVHVMMCEVHLLKQKSGFLLRNDED